MPVSTISLSGANGVSFANFSPAKKLYQPPKTQQRTATQPYEVTLTSEAKAKSMKLEGYMVSMISAKLGLDLKTVQQYLGIEQVAADALFKTTYTPPKSTYTAPKETYTEPQTLTQGRTFLASELNQLPSIRYSAAQLITSATKKTV